MFSIALVCVRHLHLRVYTLSAPTVHKRVRRGSLESDKDENGHVYVYLDEELDGPLEGGYTWDRRDEHVASLKDQIAFLRAELERKDAILLTMAQRIPELEPAAEASQSPETAAADGEGVVETPLAEQKPSWFKRFFGIGV
jgi:hypothetical protein